MSDDLNKLARAVSIAAHAGQTRRDGFTPYWTHPEAVAGMVEERLKPIAWLHDVLEDTKVTCNALKAIGIPEYVISAVVHLTRMGVETYDEYMGYIINHGGDSIAVKIADMKHNLSCQPSENSRLKIEKWLPILEAIQQPTANPSTDGRIE